MRVASNSRHFLDAHGWSRYQSDRRRRVFVALWITVAIVGIGLSIASALR